MKYSKRKDKYCNNVLNDNFHEIDDRLKSLEKGGGGSGGGSNTVYLKQVEYDALPDTKLSNDVEYRITDSGTESVKASNVSYDNTFSGLDANNVQTAIDKVHGNMGGLRFGYDGDSNTYGYYGADGSLIPFSSGCDGVELVELWTNPSPTSVFKGQTIELDLSEYESVVVCARNTYNSTSPTYGYGFGYVDGSTNYICATVARTRSFVATETGVTFGNGTYQGGAESSSDGKSCVPVTVYGVKSCPGHGDEGGEGGAKSILIAEQHNFRQVTTIDIKAIYDDYSNLSLDNFYIKNAAKTGALNSSVTSGYAKTLTLFTDYDSASGTLSCATTSSGHQGAETWVVGDIYLVVPGEDASSGGEIVALSKQVGGYVKEYTVQNDCKLLIIISTQQSAARSHDIYINEELVENITIAAYGSGYSKYYDVKIGDVIKFESTTDTANLHVIFAEFK